MADSEAREHLVCGDVRGQFTALFNRVNTVNKKNGPFQMVLCVGSFFSSSPNSRKEWSEFRVSSPTAPLPIYIIGPNSPEEAMCYPNVNSGGDLLPDLTFLGRQGVYTTPEGLTIAFLSGVEAGSSSQSTGASHVYQKSDMESLAANSQSDDFAGVDILLTSEWPQNIQKFATTAPPVASQGSASVSQLARLLQPRYHFAAGVDVFYERAPYRNHQILVENPRHVTRFLSIANVGNPDKKNRWIYAFQITPMSKMEKTELVKQPDMSTESPIAFTPAQMDAEKERQKAAAGADGGQQQFFFDMSASQRGGRGRGGHRGRGRGRDHDRGGGGGGGHQERGGHAGRGQYRDGPPHHHDGGAPAKRQFDDRGQDCWFCLGSAKVEKHLIVTVGSQCYVALAKGPLVDDHLLVLPIGHHPDSVSLPPAVHLELEAYKKAIVAYCDAKKHSCVFFERNFRSRHMQLQAVPTRHSPEAVKNIFKSHGQERGITLISVTDDETLDQLVDKHPNYFSVEFADGQRLFHFIKPNSNFPLQFAREVLASPDLLDLPRRVHWKDVQLSTEEETALVQKVRSRFAQYDPAADDDEDDE